jgi:hypothetical protein
MPGKAQHLLECVFGRAAEAGAAVEGDIGTWVAHPLNKAPEEQSFLFELEKLIEHLAIEQSEIRHSALDLDAAEIGEQPVIQPGCPALEGGKIFGIPSHRLDDLVAFSPFVHKQGNNIGRMLEIGVHGYDGITSRMGKPRDQRILVSEIS